MLLVSMSKNISDAHVNGTLHQELNAHIAMNLL